MGCSTPSFHVLHYLLEFAQIHVQWICDSTTISSSATHFSICLKSFPVSESFPMSCLFIAGGQGIGISFSLLINISLYGLNGLNGSLVFLTWNSKHPDNIVIVPSSSCLKRTYLAIPENFNFYSSRPSGDESLYRD